MLRGLAALSFEVPPTLFLLSRKAARHRRFTVIQRMLEELVVVEEQLVAGLPWSELRCSNIAGTLAGPCR